MIYEHQNPNPQPHLQLSLLCLPLDMFEFCFPDIHFMIYQAELAIFIRIIDVCPLSLRLREVPLRENSTLSDH